MSEKAIPRQRTIYIDTDGVIADFVGHLCRYLEFPLENWPSGVYDLESALGMSRQELWRPCERADFWMTIPVYDHAKALIDGVRKHGRVVLCTQEISAVGLLGRRVWYGLHFPQFPWLWTNCKSLLSQANTVLIDDCDENIVAFRGEGKAILFPRRWNSGCLHEEEAVTRVLEAL